MPDDRGRGRGVVRLDGVGLSAVVGRDRVHPMWMPAVIELLATQLAELRASAPRPAAIPSDRG